MIAVAVLAVNRREHPSDPAYESELASVERHGLRTIVVLDDGTTLEFDTSELHAATGPRDAVARRAA